MNWKIRFHKKEDCPLRSMLIS